jgi:hypothetical protein
MEFEAIEPAHRAFANGRHIFENPVSFDAFVFAYSHFSGINKGDTGALAETNEFQKEGKGNHNFSIKLNKTIVRQQIGKFALQMFSDIKQIKMFQVAKTVTVKTNHNGDDLGVGHGK